MSKTSLDEQIANALVDNAVNDGFLISVNDLAETVVKPITEYPRDHQGDVQHQYGHAHP
jgi:hypothetical protein